MTKSKRTAHPPGNPGKSSKPVPPGKAKGRPRGRGISRQRILSISTRLFADRGFAALSMRDIATASQLNIPSIYHFFGGKENLYRSCCNAEFAAVAAKLKATLLADAAPKTRIHDFSVGLCEALLGSRDFRRLLLQEIIMRDESHHFDELSTQFFLPEFRMLVSAIAELEGRRGAAEHAFSIYALTFGLVLLRQTFEVAGVNRARATVPRRFAERVLSIVLPQHQWHG